jgi:hypothetical protein
VRWWWEEGKKREGKRGRDGGWGRCNIICAMELFFFTLYFEIWDVRFPYCCPAIIIIAPSDFSYRLTAYKALEALGTVPMCPSSLLCTM